MALVIFRVTQPESVRINNAAKRAMMEAKAKAAAKPRVKRKLSKADMIRRVYRQMIADGRLVNHDTFEAMRNA